MNLTQVRCPIARSVSCNAARPPTGGSFLPMHSAPLFLVFRAPGHFSCAGSVGPHESKFDSVIAGSGLSGAGEGPVNRPTRATESF